MQAVARVVEHLIDMAPIKGLQGLAEFVTHLFGAGSVLAFGYFVLLVDVVVRQTIKALHGVVQTRRGHAPCADGCANEVDGLCALRQPLAKQKAVQWPEDQALGASRGRRDDANVLGLQAIGLDVSQGFGASVDVQGFQGAASCLLLQTLQLRKGTCHG